MKLFESRLLAISVCAVLTGCGNLSTISRHTDLPGAAVAVHLDAAQRVVVARADGPGGSFVCSEPAPDALQALAASLGASVVTSTGQTAAVSNTLSSSTASIGLRTQSITLMREILYSICLMQYNKQLTSDQAMAALERSQDLTLGVLAIEQLTGAVVARQAAASGETSSSTSANVNNTQAQLAAARKVESECKDALVTATKDQASASTEADLEKAKLAEANAKTPLPADLAAIVTANEDAKTALSKANDALTLATLNFNSAHTATEAISNSFNAAAATANGSAKTSVTNIGEANQTYKMDSSSVNAIATATQTIVWNVLNKGRIIESCMNAMADSNRTLSENFIKVCNLAIETYTKFYLTGNTQTVPPIPVLVVPTEPTKQKLSPGLLKKIQPLNLEELTK